MSPSRMHSVAALLFLAPFQIFAADAVAKSRGYENPVLWREPIDIQSKDMLYGSGGKDHAPQGKFTFEKEDTDGTNPKLTVRDEAGVKWKVKLGVEARPETVASRFVWAAGYITTDDYFLPTISVDSLPTHLKRGQNLRRNGNSFENVRLKRDLKGYEKVDDWKWSKSPFNGSRELDGLRVLMALINNWDLKNENNAVYVSKDKDGTKAVESIFLVSDLGASFGTTGESLGHAKSKGNLKSYEGSKFIRKASSDYIDFGTPSRPALIFIFNPHEFFSRIALEKIGHNIPRDHARWIGQSLAKLSPEQLRDAFRSAGYTPEQVNAFASIVAKRIGELNQL